MKIERAYSLLEIKAADDDKRILTGIATTPTPDRMDDVVEPEGVEFELPIPFLWQHNSDKPVGRVTKAKVTKKGIEVEIQIEKTDEPGLVKDRLDAAWQDIKLRLVRGLSIGFKGIETARIEGTYGIRFLKWLWLELSAVTIAANGDCSIATIKSIDAELLAASGRKQEGDDQSTSAGVTARKSTPVVKAMEAKTKMKTIAERIAAFEATRAAKAAELQTLQDKVGDEGRTKDAAEKEAFETLSSEIKAIDDELVDLRKMETLNLAAAKPVQGKSQEEASQSRAGVAVVSVRRNVDKGIIFTRLLGAKYAAYKSMGAINPVDFAKARFSDTPEVEMILRAAVAAGSTTDTTWAAPLYSLEQATNEFVELLRAATIIDRLGLRRVPFNIKVPRATADPAVSWVGEAGVKPVSSAAFDSIELRFTKVAGIVPITEELMRFSNPAAEGLIRDALIAAIAYLTDRDFLDPTKTEVTGVSPASVTNGVTPVTATGTTADALRDDLATLLAAYAAANMNLAGLKLVMTSQQAIKIGLMRNSLGQKEFESLGVNGGSLEGIPVITSENIVATGGSPTDGGLIVAINTPEIMLADDGAVDIDISREASLQMDSAPDSPTNASTVLVSLWQRNMVAIKAERFINWKARRTGAVQFIQNAKYN